MGRVSEVNAIIPMLRCDGFTDLSPQAPTSQPLWWVDPVASWVFLKPPASAPVLPAQVFSENVISSLAAAYETLTSSATSSHICAALKAYLKRFLLVKLAVILFE